MPGPICSPLARRRSKKSFLPIVLQGAIAEVHEATQEFLTDWLVRQDVDEALEFLSDQSLLASTPMIDRAMKCCVTIRPADL